MHIFVLDSPLKSSIDAARILYCAAPSAPAVVICGGKAVPFPPSHPDGLSGEILGSEDVIDPHRILKSLEVAAQTSCEHRKQKGWKAPICLWIFLCSPPIGMGLIQDKLEMLLQKLSGLQAKVTLLMHPNAYDQEMLNRVGRSLWPDYKTPHGLVRCTVEDTAILKHLFGCPSCLGTAICHEDFVKTLDMEPQHYLPCDKITVFKNWKICFGEMPMPSSFQVEHTSVLTEITNEIHTMEVGEKNKSNIQQQQEQRDCRMDLNFFQ